MSELDKYMDDIRRIVDKYRHIESEMKLLLEKTTLLNQQKLAIELELNENRERERDLVHKIKEETGIAPNFLEILERIND